MGYASDSIMSAAEQEHLKNCSCNLPTIAKPIQRTAQMSALSSIRIRNYRCFKDHTVDLSRSTILVGKNNAGKSTLIETLRIVSIALKRFSSVTSSPAPRWLDDDAVGPGQNLRLDRLGIATSTVFHRYGEPPATIDATFADGARLVVHIGAEGDSHCVFFNCQGRSVRARRDIGSLPLPRISILPQIVPLEHEERELLPDYVKQHLDSHLASRHFRNQLQLLHDSYFSEFKNLVEETWPGVSIAGLESIRSDGFGTLQLMVRDGDFVAEAGWMGHGLQMWLQTLWFIVRSRGGGTVVLDEPDVYMHPDLQRKLVRILRAQGADILIATHSTEILAEVDADNVLILDRERPKSFYATDLPSLQRVVENIGSAQNLQIARLWRARSLILVEGEDMKLLKRVHDLIFSTEKPSLDTIPHWAIGGWGGWSSVAGSVATLKNSVHESIRCYCVFDSDYHLDDEILARRAQAKAQGVQVHIHSVKEIENFLAIPSLIRRALERSVRPPNIAPSEDAIDAAIERIAEELREDALDGFATQFNVLERQITAGVASRRAREHVRLRTQGPRGLRGVVSGKTLLSKLSDWSKHECGTSFGVNGLIKALRRDEVDPELEHLVRAIADGKQL